MENTYKGKTCRKCGSNERYISNRKCVHCKKQINKVAYVRHKAEGYFINRAKLINNESVISD